MAAKVAEPVSDGKQRPTTKCGGVECRPAEHDVLMLTAAMKLASCFPN